MPVIREQHIQRAEFHAQVTTPLGLYEVHT